MQQHSTFWIPPSYQDREVAAVRKAVAEYDSNLDFGKNDKTGQWCVFLRQGTMAGSQGGDLPVLGFNTIPHPDDVLKRLYQSDALRRGSEILDEMERHNENIHAPGRAKVTEAEGELAEAFEWGFHKTGETAYKKIYLP